VEEAANWQRNAGAPPKASRVAHVTVVSPNLKMGNKKVQRLEQPADAAIHADENAKAFGQIRSSKIDSELFPAKTGE